MPRAASAAAVAGPIAATLACENALASLPAAAKRPNTASTPLVLVKMTHLKLRELRQCGVQRRCLGQSGSTAIVGNSTASAP